MTEGQYQALEGEIREAASPTYWYDQWREAVRYRNMANAEVERLKAELAARDAEITVRDAVIEQIRALAEEWRANSRRCNRCANDLDRVLSSLPSTGETNDGKH
jgi:uncharacterized membrane protein